MFCPSAALNEEQQRIIFTLSTITCAINGYISDETQNTLLHISSELLEECDVSKEKIQDDLNEFSDEQFWKHSEFKSDIMKIGDNFEDERTRRLLLLVVLIIALSDGDISNNQKRFINLVAISLDLDIETIAELAKLAEEYVELNKNVATIYVELNEECEVILKAEEKEEDFGW